MRTVTAQQLIEELEQLPPDAPVAFASDYGDHCHTQQVHFLDGDINKTSVGKNAYSNSGYAVTDDEADAEETVYLIS
jgi:hypothetical protein